MGTRTEYAPGTFCWIELQAGDQEGAKRFYAELLGWIYDDHAIGEGVTYSMAKVGGAEVAAISPPRSGDPSPPHWNNYVSVEDAARSAARAAELGGSVLADAFDVLEAGRMAVIQDPTGAVLALWEPGESIGATLVNAVGAFTWNELATPDVETATRFYGDLFGWGSEAMDTGGGPAYTVVAVGERSNGGIREQGPEEREAAPANWMPYVAVESTDAAAGRVGELGGAVILEPMDVPSGGRIAAARDLDGAVFGLWEGPMDD